ncbi:uncharacterized protein LOC136751824 [Amia ocellicauda]|uniref:uncharacterized protein LOC136751824 n=1 Tax=Amia ocellicauda TaxID=2972642 RepID=UPI0034645FA8
MVPHLVMMLFAAMALFTPLTGEDNELEYGYWNYRDGADWVSVRAVRSVTRVLDHWGNRIFTEVKNLLHSQPNSVLPDYSRVRPLSESLGDLFREVTLLQRRLSELSQRLDTVERALRRHGYHPGRVQGQVEQGAVGDPGPASLRQPRPLKRRPRPVPPPGTHFRRRTLRKKE